ncbi:MAG TPA: molybdopterin-dependent oxidoreductase [Chloroflexia bacterium]|nr:molybdopterin-dependent oxidoreductase [Chloroflexia bacterium]
MTGANPPETRLHRGFGAGAGAGLAMIVAMGLARLMGVQSIPELLQGTFLALVPGDFFEFMIHLLGPGAKVLLLVQILEGILLVGGILGWLFVRQWHPAGPEAPPYRQLLSERYAGGFFYGFLIGAALVAIFFLLNAIGWLNPSPADSAVPGIVVSLLFYGVVFGVALVSLLPWPGTQPQATAGTLPVDGERRDFLRVAGGTALALVGGTALWGLLTTVLAEPAKAELVGLGPTATPDAAEAADLATAITESGGDLAAIADVVPTSTPGAATVPPSATTAPAPADTATSAPPAATDTTGPVVEPAATDTTVPAAPTDTAVPAAPTDTTVPPTAVAQVPPSPTVFPAVPALSPEITPVENFYITTKNVVDPTVDGAKWTLTIKGLVEKPLTLTLADLKAMPQVKVIHTLACISNEVGGSLIGNGRWTGVRVADLMKKVRPKAGVADVLFTGADDYTDSVPLSVLMNPDTVLAYEMNGKPLTAKHGYPARLLIPGIFGMKNLKWLTTIDLVDHDVLGYWQTRGWSDPAPYLTMSRIDYPNENIKQAPLYVTGIAHAGNRGIKRVELSLDGGKTWADAQLKPPLGRNAWVLWTYPWIPTKPGNVMLVVRATDGTGQVQTAQEQGNYPNGATGYHKVNVRVLG